MKIIFEIYIVFVLTLKYIHNFMLYFRKLKSTMKTFVPRKYTYINNILKLTKVYYVLNWICSLRMWLTRKYIFSPNYTTLSLFAFAREGLRNLTANCERAPYGPPSLPLTVTTQRGRNIHVLSEIQTKDQPFCNLTLITLPYGRRKILFNIYHNKYTCSKDRRTKIKI